MSLKKQELSEETKEVNPQLIKLMERDLGINFTLEEKVNLALEMGFPEVPQIEQVIKSK